MRAGRRPREPRSSDPWAYGCGYVSRVAPAAQVLNRLERVALAAVFGRSGGAQRPAALRFSREPARSAGYIQQGNT